LLGGDVLKITDNVYALDSTKGNYSYLILDEEIILVDTGRPGQGKGILNELKSMNIKPDDIKHILITHHDIDHIGNAALLQQATGATLWASKEDIPYICGDKNRPGIKWFFSVIMRARNPENITAYKEHQKISNIEVIPSPGHTPGHVCLLYKDVLFAGDLVRSSKGLLKPPASIMNWDENALIESIKKLDKYSFKWVCPAHGEPVKRDALWEHILKN
jgi:glyoxylase-like metal-dependent hydrolase (beta-lactamase superfamily II)